MGRLEAGAAVSSNQAPRAHWAFERPKAGPIPRPQNPAWCRSPIDHFVLTTLEAHRLKPAPPADRTTLIRRVNYDLTGLPPIAEEVDQFVADSGGDAYERLVDRLLASPRYGERWGRHWLDVARYADTKGYVYYYEESRFVQPYHYRDWVIRAMNEDLPYDRFLLLQVAADHVLPGTGNTRTSAGASTLNWPPPVFPSDVSALGFLTLGRRFLDQAPDIIDDQIDVVMRGTQAMTAGCARCHDHKFDPIPTRDYYSLYGVFLNSEERLVALQAGPQPDQLLPYAKAKAYVEFEQGAAERVKKLETKFQQAAEEVRNRLRTRVKDYLLAVLDVAKLPSDANVRPQPEDINPFNVRQWEKYLSRPANATDAIFAPWHAFLRMKEDEFAQESPRVTAALQAPTAPRLHPLVAKAFAQPPTNRTEVAARYGDLLTAVHRAVASNSVPGQVATEAALNPADLEFAALKAVLYGPDSPVHPPRGLITELDVHLYFDDPNRVELAKLQMDLEQWLIKHTPTAQYSVILQDRAQPTVPVIFRRGDPLKPGDAVPSRFPEALSPPGARPFEQGSGRLELAKAIIDPANPLTARVMVNRIWAHHFGKGLVDTPSDFGTRSTLPSHPELLDWLALRFVAEGWSMKALHRLILLSSTYQQSAAPEPSTATAAHQADPDNHWLWKFNRERLDFESLRDSLLACSGGLDLTAGGPSVELHQKPFGKRRAVYGFMDRKFVPTSARSFDFANPDMHSPERHVTAVPQQALFLFNSPFVAERCRQLIQRLQLGPTAGAATSEGIKQVYRAVLQRFPTAQELEQAIRFLNEASEDSGPAGTKEPTLTPWEQLAQVLFFSNDFLFVD